MSPLKRPPNCLCVLCIGERLLKKSRLWYAFAWLWRRRVGTALTVGFVSSVLGIGTIIWSLSHGGGSPELVEHAVILTGTPSAHSTAEPIVSKTPVATPMPIPSDMPTASPYPSPLYFAAGGAAGGEDINTQYIYGAVMDNLGPESYAAFAAIEDVDPYHNVIYIQDRQDVPPHDRRTISFISWTPGACYVARVLIARTPKGLINLITAAASGEGYPPPSFIATGDVEIAYTSDRVCATATPVATHPMTEPPAQPTPTAP